MGKWEEKMFQKIQESIQLLTREYLQDFSIAPETRTQDLQKIVLALEEFYTNYYRDNAAGQATISR